MSYLPVLYPNLGRQHKESLLFVDRAFQHYKSPIFELTNNVKSADYLLIPHNFNLIKNRKDYLSQYIFWSKKYNKKIIIFSYGDSDNSIDIPNSIIFRTSQYRYKKRSNEIMMPAYVEDLSEHRKIQFRNKNAKPVIGFCGWADYTSYNNRLKTLFKNALIDIKKYITPNRHLDVHKKGIFFRKKAINNLQKSSLVETNFIIRKSYSAHKTTIGLSPKVAREEYIDNVFHSDFTLAIKGDGNFSCRFYEALSLGRIPILINTDCVLPLEDTIDYKEFTVFIDYKNIGYIDKLISSFYYSLDNGKFIYMQRKARDAFEKFLRIDSFFNFIFRAL